MKCKFCLSNGNDDIYVSPNPNSYGPSGITFTYSRKYECGTTESFTGFYSRTKKCEELETQKLRDETYI